MNQRIYIALIILLGLITSSTAVYAATNDCPKDSIISYSQNGTCTYLERYNYDDAGRTTLSEKWRMNEDSVLVGNSKTTTEYYPNGKTKETASWMWSDAKNDWIGSTKYVYEYDNDGNLTLQATYTWSVEIDGWIPNYKTEYTFNDKGKKTLEVTYTGGGTVWVPISKHEFDYDINNRQILHRIWNGYDPTTDTWIGLSWKAWEYKSSTYPSKESMYEEYDWQNDSWNGINKYELEYNSSGRIILKRTFVFDVISSSWNYSVENHYAFDQWGNTILNEQYIWSSDHWYGTGKIEYTFRAYGKQVGKATYSWDDTNRKWIGVEKAKTLFDGNDNLILDEQYTWHNNDWAGTKKEEMIYDDAKNIISKKTYQWLQESTQWINATKDSSAFDANKNKILEEHYTWNTSESYWVGTGEKHVSEYTNNMETLQEVYIWNTELKDWTYKSKIIKEFDGTKMTLDEEYALKGDVLEGTKKEKYAYNAKGETVMTVKYSWLHDYVWQGTDSVLANYDNNKQQTLNEKYTWETLGDYWKGSEKATYTFNKNKQQTSSWVYSWDDTNRQWIYTSRDTSSYDNKKNLTLDERYTYDVTNQAWVGTLKKEYAYNTKGQQTMFAYYAWDETISKFIGTQKEENEMDDAGRTILHASYTWNDTDWKGKSKDTYTYFRNDTIADHITFTWKSSKWTESKKTTDSYSDAGQHVSTANYTWTGSAWAGSKMTAWTYTESGKIFTEIVSTWGTTDWVNSTKLENTYTEEVLTAYVNSKWESNAWLNVSKWEQTDPNTDCTFEWWNSAWSKTQENKKEYDSENRLILESKQNWQQGVPTAGSKTEYTYTGSNLTQKSNYTYDSGWIETNRETNAFDEANRQTLAMTQVFENGTQTSGDKTTHTYNGEGLQTNITISTWAGSDWLYVSKVDNAYEGKSVTTTSYVWDNTKPEWQGVEKDEKIYSNDLDYTSTKSEWRNGGWFGISKTGYTYYVDGREYTIVDYLWSSSTWVEDFKTEYAYSGANNKVTATYTYQDQMWVGQTKEGVYYDEYEDLTTATWTWKNNAWSPQSKSGQSLLDDGRTKSKTSYKISGSDFIYTARVEYEYGNTEKDITTANYTWNVTEWKGVSKSGEVWDGSKISSKITYTWTGGFTWQYNQKTEYEYGSHQSDLTTAIYTWTTDQVWVGVSKSGKTYAQTGKQASEFSYTWGTTAAGNADWLPMSKTEWEYGSGKDNGKATYKGVDTAWVGISKYAEQYTSTGDSLGFYTYCWKNNDWADSLKTEWKYYEDGKVEFYIQAKNVNGSWSNLETSAWWELKYDAADHIILDAYYTWDPDLVQWYGNSRIQYSYDDLENITFYEVDTWNGSSWIGKTKATWVYNSASKILSCETWSWNKTKRKWAGTSKYENGYYHDTIQNMTATYRWNSSKWKFEGTSKSETLYDEAGNQIAFCKYKWDSSKWDWIGMFKTETIYDEKNRVIEQTSSRYDTDWYYDTKIQYVYDDKHGQIERTDYTFYEGGLVLTYHNKQEYDSDANSKLRTDLDAAWETTGEVTKYEYTSYYYACDPKFQVEVKASPEEGGTVSGGGEFILNGQARITATAEEDCYTFKQWQDSTGQVVATTPTHIFLVNENNKGTYTAIFEPILRTIRASVKDNIGGSVRVAIKPDE